MIRSSGHFFAATFAWLFISTASFGTEWNWALAGSTLPGGTGTFNACEATTQTQITGNYSRPTTGFVHMTSPSCSNQCSVTNGVCSSCTPSTTGSCTSIPSDIYAIELAGVHLIVQPVLTNPAETQPIYNIVTGTCPSAASTTYNFIFSQWSSSNNTASASQIGVGTFTWQTNGSANVTAAYDLVDYNLISGLTFSLPNGGCSNGQVQLTGATGSDRAGTMYITNEGEFFYQTQANHAVFGIPQVQINSPSELTGNYSGFIYDASGSNTVIPVTQMYVGPTGNSISG